MGKERSSGDERTPLPLSLQKKVGVYSVDIPNDCREPEWQASKKSFPFVHFISAQQQSLPNRGGT